MAAKRRIVAVIGGQRPKPEALTIAEEVGRRLAEAGAVIVCGGLGGVMEAACRGAKSAGGLTIGILPGDGGQAANEFVDIPIVTGMGTARNVIIVRTADAIVAIDGGFGTLSEMAHALDLGKPLISVGAWDLVGIGVDRKRIRRAKTVQEAVHFAFGRTRLPTR